MTTDLDALHQQLEAFNVWYESTLEKEGADEKVQTPLFHYTSASALQGIIESQKIWLTSMFHLIDPARLCRED
jgi:hypothetical protein